MPARWFATCFVLVISALFGAFFLCFHGPAEAQAASDPHPERPGTIASCPDIALAEKEEDCPWAKVARTMIVAADNGHPVVPILKESTPQLVKQIEQDAKNPAFRQLWGMSINFDEFAKGVIVHPAILEALAEVFGAPKPSERIVHAGMEHVYGYLFSVLKTSFGYKRARWVQPTLEQAFELSGGLLGPKPSQGTLFSNLTYFLGRIAFRSDRKELDVVRNRGSAHVEIPRTLLQFPYNKLKITRLAETVTFPSELNKARKIFLRTDFVSFLRVPEGQKNTHLLIYSVVDPQLGGARLITAFPVEKSFYEKAIHSDGLGPDKPVMTRYNAYIEGLSGKEFKGERQVIQSEKPLN